MTAMRVLVRWAALTMAVFGMEACAQPAPDSAQLAESLVTMSSNAARGRYVDNPAEQGNTEEVSEPAGVT